MLGVLLPARQADADTPQTLGALMAFGGTGTEPLCLTGDVFTDTVSLTECDESNYSDDEQNWQMYSDGTLHLIIGGSDYGCLDIYANNPANGVADLNPGGEYPCNGNEADAWALQGEGQLIPDYHQTYCLYASGTSVGIEECATSMSQVWLPLEYTFRLNNTMNPDYVSNACLDVFANDQSEYNLLDIASCNTTSAQWFTFRPVPSAESVPFQATLWSQNSSGDPGCMVDANSNLCYGYSPVACLSQCSSTTPSTTTQIFNYQYAGFLESSSSYTGELMVNFGYSDDDYTCMGWDQGGAAEYDSAYLYLLDDESCANFSNYGMGYSIEIQASGWN